MSIKCLSLFIFTLDYPCTYDIIYIIMKVLRSPIIKAIVIIAIITISALAVQKPSFAEESSQTGQNTSFRIDCDKVREQDYNSLDTCKNLLDILETQFGGKTCENGKIMACTIYPGQTEEYHNAAVLYNQCVGEDNKIPPYNSDSTVNDLSNNPSNDSKSLPVKKEDLNEISAESTSDEPLDETYPRTLAELPDVTPSDPAADSNNPAPSTSTDQPSSNPTSSLGSCRPLLGMISWDCNVPLLNGGNINQDSLGSSIWTIAANVATDITVIAAYLVIGYIIYGGYLYIFSAGDTGKAMSGKKAIHQALMGLAIVISANVILNSLRIALVGATGSFSADCITTSKCVDPSTMVQSAFSWVIGISGIISAAFMVYAGITYTTSRGDANKVQSAKQIITYALIGMIIVTLAELIVIFASDIINNANDEGMYVNQLLIKP